MTFIITFFFFNKQLNLVLWRSTRYSPHWTEHSGFAHLNSNFLFPTVKIAKKYSASSTLKKNCFERIIFNGENFSMQKYEKYGILHTKNQTTRCHFIWYIKKYNLSLEEFLFLSMMTCTVVLYQISDKSWFLSISCRTKLNY